MYAVDSNDYRKESQELNLSIHVLALLGLLVALDDEQCNECLGQRFLHLDHPYGTVAGRKAVYAQLQ
jgi:hypothetical protein